MINNTNLSKIYKFTYKCSLKKCNILYGSDKEENGKHLCPIHDSSFKDEKFKSIIGGKV